MKTYQFGTITKTLKRNTFEIEETVKDSIGLNDENDQKVIAIQKEFVSLQKEFGLKPAKKRKEQILSQLDELNKQVIGLQNQIKWSNTFENCIKVVGILFVEGADGLTKSNFGRFDAERAWQDFFTAPTPNENE